MLDIKFIRDNPDVVKQKVATKNFDATKIDALLVHDKKVQELQQKIEGLRAERNKIAAMGPHAADQGRKIKEELQGLSDAYNVEYGQLQEILLSVPNLPTDDTPVGADESENKVVKQVGEKPTFDFTPKEHWELGESLDIIDNQRAAKVTGARFTYLKGGLAQLQFALVQYALSVLTNESTLKEIAEKNNLDVVSKPFLPVIPPVAIRPEAMQRMARLEPKDERYYIASDDLYLIGSAEHTLGAMHMDEMIPESHLPIRYAGYSTAFRREAGSYGKDTKGILRLHQFDKLEIESFCLPEHSFAEHEFFVAIEEYLVQSLGIAYQIVQSCTGDLGDPNARKLDIECWMPGQNKYRETHSADYMTDYQARRLKTKVKRTTGESEFVHMNDATAFAIGRTLIAIMENYQQADGTIAVPQVLIPYAGFEKIG